MQTQTTDPSSVQTMKIDMSTLNKGECTCLGHMCYRLCPLVAPKG